MINIAKFEKYYLFNPVLRKLPAIMKFCSRTKCLDLIATIIPIFF